MHWSPPGSSVHGISQARILEWVAISYSRGSSQSRDQTHVSCIGRHVLYHWATFLLGLKLSRLRSAGLSNLSPSGSRLEFTGLGVGGLSLSGLTQHVTLDVIDWCWTWDERISEMSFFFSFFSHPSIHPLSSAGSNRYEPSMWTSGTEGGTEDGFISR